MIRLENLSKYYYSANAVAPALRKINLEFGIGEFIAITGESGSGKSTLLNIISGMDTYDDGELFIGGEETSFYDDADWEEYRKNKIGFVFQNYNLIENYSSLYNVESSLLIQGYNNKEARKIAKKLLKQVGLEGKMQEHAMNLSSGQKQRLSIARALAKNTDIIVADEPTGNLDSETGKQIMQLFCELSKDRLIIVVTHNYEEAKPFVTRKIRLHEGEIVSDEQVIHEDIKKATDVYQNEHAVETDKDNTGYHKTLEHVAAGNPKPQQGANETSKLEDNSNIHANVHTSSNKINSDRHIAWSFSWMNITTQPKRVMFFTIFLIIAAAVYYIFLGEIISNMDDTLVKKYNDTVFLNSDTTRIVVKNKDSSELTNKDMKTFNEIKNVKMADQYGFCNDINYYIKKNKDFNYTYAAKEDTEKGSDGKTVNFMDTSHFMKSSTCIHKEDLLAGSLPKNRNDIVLYSNDEKVVGKEMLCYFTSQNIWGSSEYYYTTLKVVGLLKKKTDQVFFSGELCNMLSAGLYGDHYSLDMCWVLLKAAYTEQDTMIPVIGDMKDYGNTSSLSVSKNLILNGSGSPLGQANLNLFHGEPEEGESADKKINASVISLNDFTPKFMEMSENQFHKLVPYKSRQASLYLNDYINTDYVLAKLTKLGYVAISSYRTSALSYDNNKVMNRSKIVVIAILVLLIMSIFEIILIRSIFKMKRKDFIVLKSMGMSWKTMKLMNLYEMLVYTLVSVALVPMIAKIIGLCRFQYLLNVIKYYNILTFPIYVILNILVITVTIWSVDRYLKRKQKWS